MITQVLNWLSEDIQEIRIVLIILWLCTGWVLSRFIFSSFYINISFGNKEE